MIPKTLHFIWFGCGCVPTTEQLIGVYSAAMNTTYKIVLHTDVSGLVIPGVQIRSIEVPSSINGIAFENERVSGYEGKGMRISHVKDIIRLKILLEEGGIYSDCDCIWLRNPHEFIEKKVVIGWSNKAYKILINCVIMAEPNHPAIKKYLDWCISIYPPKKYWTPANPYKIWKDEPDVFFAEKYKFNAKKWNDGTEVTWEDVEKSVCVHLCHSANQSSTGEVIDYILKSIRV